LVVGAPLYYEKKKAGGAIYVYMGKDGGVSHIYRKSVTTGIIYC
jgi:hypothetical protein